MGRPVTHFEIASSDLERASAFYRELFDWEIGEEEIDGYRLVRTAEGSIGGGLMRSSEGVFPEELGGKMIVEPMPIPGVGRFAMFQDPEGVMIGIFEED